MDGEELTIKGQVLATGDTNVQRIDLFDGLFTTGYRLTSFVICPSSILSSEAMSARLTTQDTSHKVNWDWDDNLEIGWSLFRNNTHVNAEFSRVDLDATIIEDLFIDVSADTGEKVNYMITLRKVTFPIQMGALNMVRNRSQA